MADQDNEGIFNLSGPAVMTFPNVDEARSVQVKGRASGEPKFSTNIEFEPDSSDLKAAKAHCVKVARAKWPGCDLATLRFPFTDGNKLADKAKDKGKDREFSRGKVVLTARSKYQPRLSVIENGKVRDLESPIDLAPGNLKQLFYTGVGVLAQLNFVAYDGVGEDGKPGVTAYLNMVVSTKKGKKLISGGASAAEVFKGYIGTATDENPEAADLDDEIPF